MRKIFTLLSIISTIQLHAQTFTYANFSQSLGVATNVAIANTSSFNVSLVSITGNGVTWDASGLTPMAGFPSVHIIFGNPSSTPYGSLYPSSNYAQYDPALVAVLDYEYDQITADSMVMWGTYGVSGKHEIYQDPDKRMIFPFAYGQSFTDNYVKTNYSDATTVSSYQNGMRTVSFNGFGTLKLPQGSFANVALISELRTNNLGPNSTTYTWYQISDGKKLLMASENNGSATIAYTIDNSTGLDVLTRETPIVLFPNPVSSASAVQIIADGSLKNALFTLTDVTGRFIKSFDVENNRIQLGKSSLSAGIYYYTIKGEGTILKTGMLIME